MRIIKVKPTGTRKAFGHIHYTSRPHEWGEFEMPTYPPSPMGERLRDERQRRDFGLRETARALGLRAEQVSGLEHGRYTVDDWDALFAMLP